MPKQHSERCIQTAKNRGYNTNKLLMVVHEGTGN
jgi:lipocalin